MNEVWIVEDKAYTRASVVRGYPSQEIADEAVRTYRKYCADYLPGYNPNITVQCVVINSEPLLYFTDPKGVYEP